MDETAKYLPRLLAWVGDKIIFWQWQLPQTPRKGLTIIIEGIIFVMLIKRE